MEYLGQRTTTIVESFENDGVTEVTIKMIQARSLDGVEWEEKSIEATAISEEVDRAIALAFTPINEHLAAIGYDLFEEVEESGDNLL